MMMKNVHTFEIRQSCFTLQEINNASGKSTVEHLLLGKLPINSEYFFLNFKFLLDLIKACI